MFYLKWTVVGNIRFGRIPVPPAALHIYNCLKTIESFTRDCPRTIGIILGTLGYYSGNDRKCQCRMTSYRSVCEAAMPAIPENNGIVHARQPENNGVVL